MTPSETIHLPLLGPEGTEEPCSLELYEDEDGEVFRLRLQGAPGLPRELEGAGESLFDALTALRRELEPQGFRLRCAGSAVDVYPSGMSRSMGDGRKAYRLTPGEPGLTKDLVDIFDVSEKDAPATVAEQEAFFQRWVESLR
jgi:hypothetical protein